MSERKTSITTRQLARLLADLRAFPIAPVGACLLDETFADYATGHLPLEEIGRVDEHLRSCAACLSEMALLVEAFESWRGEQGEARLGALRKWVRAQWGQVPAAAAPQPGPPLAGSNDAISGSGMYQYLYAIADQLPVGWRAPAASVGGPVKLRRLDDLIVLVSSLERLP